MDGSELYEVCIVGDLALPPGVAKAWRALPLDPSAYADWPDAFARTVTGDEIVSVGAWLDDCECCERPGARTFLDVEERPDGLRLAALLDTPEYDRFRVQIATMFRLVDRVGGTASLVILSAPDAPVKLGYRLEVVEGGRSSMQALSPAEIAAAQREPAVARVLARQAA